MKKAFVSGLAGLGIAAGLFAALALLASLHPLFVQVERVFYWPVARMEALVFPIVAALTGRNGPVLHRELATVLWLAIWGSLAGTAVWLIRGESESARAEVPTIRKH